MKPSEQRLERLEQKAEPDHYCPRVTVIRPDLTREEGQRLQETLPVADSKGRPIIHVVIAATTHCSEARALFLRGHGVAVVRAAPPLALKCSRRS